MLQINDRKRVSGGCTVNSKRILEVNSCKLVLMKAFVSNREIFIVYTFSYFKPVKRYENGTCLVKIWSLVNSRTAELDLPTTEVDNMNYGLKSGPWISTAPGYSFSYC
jgi:hypothetical protein